MTPRTLSTALVVVVGALASCAGPRPAEAGPALDGAAELATPTGPRPIPPLSPEGQDAFDVLQRTTRFVDGMPCEGLETPEAERALWAIAREEHAAEAFLALIDSAQPAGGLLALCGLYDADPFAFEVEVERFRRVQATVPARLGCVEGDVPIANLVEWTHGPAVKLDADHPTVEAWFECYPETAMLDIVGGGFIQSLREEHWTGVQLGTIEAFNALFRARTLANGPVGYSRVESLNTAAIRKLVDECAGDQLVRLCEESPTVAGRLYGLCGLALCDRIAFEEQAKQFEGQPWTVPYQTGCLIGPRTARSVVEDLRDHHLAAKLVGRPAAHKPN